MTFVGVINSSDRNVNDSAIELLVLTQGYCTDFKQTTKTAILGTDCRYLNVGLYCCVIFIHVQVLFYIDQIGQNTKVTSHQVNILPHFVVELRKSMMKAFLLW